MKKLYIFFTAGCIGALVNSLVVWQCGQLGINDMLGVAIAPNLTSAWLYQRLVWGGLWGLLFVLPFLRSRLLYKGLVLSLLPTAVQLFMVFPYSAGKGMAGLELGLLTPALVLFFNAVWGLVTALSIRIAR
ncbi:hypothetical protein [Dasania marina]|uniref:hypothetical protein n=1 Tax=Dasania marina TaxID=471499 RepID=UPI00036D6559|nr:hypothetical protein [Dasania marina]